MSVTCGFYNSKNGDRKYNAEDFGNIFAGIIRDGVFANYPEEGNHLLVEIANSDSTQIKVGPGRCWFNGTWTNNDADLFFDIPALDPATMFDRVDAVIVDVDTRSSVRDNTIKYLTGTATGDAPTLINADGHYQHLLANVHLHRTGNRRVTISNVVGTPNGSPFITGPLETISADSVLSLWQDAVNNKIDAELADKLAEIESEIPGSLITEILSGLTDSAKAQLRKNLDIVRKTDAEVEGQLTIQDTGVDSVTLTTDASNNTSRLLFEGEKTSNVELVGLADPTRDDSAATKKYVDGKQPLDVTFTVDRSGAVTCSHSYSALTAAYRYGKTVNLKAVIYRSNGSIVNRIYGGEITEWYGGNIQAHIVFRNNNDVEHHFVYTSSSLEYTTIARSNFVVNFSMDYSVNEIGFDVDYESLSTAYSSARTIAAYLAISSGVLSCSNYEVRGNGDQRSFVFYFEQIVPDGSSSTANWTRKYGVCRVMPDNTVVYAGDIEVV